MSVDYLITGGIVIDGSHDGSSPVEADVAVQGDLIAAVGRLSHLTARQTIDARGLIVCPGFIDTHAHSEFTVLADGRAAGKAAQGMTTEINGNCGLSAAPLYGAARERREAELNELGIRERWSTFSEYFRLLESKGIALNFATLAGHGNIRASVVGYDDRPPDDNEMAAMRGLLRAAMTEGAAGLSTGLIYPPGLYADTPEIISLACEAAGHNGIYATHMRNEGDELIESLEEVVSIASGSGVRCHVSHLKTSGKKNWRKIGNALDVIDEARKRGLSVTCDRYPYTASSTDLDTVLPGWAYEGGHAQEIARLKNERTRLRRDVLMGFGGPSDWKKVMVSSVRSKKNKWMEGRTVVEIAAAQRKNEIDSVFDLLIEEDLAAGAVFFTMNEDNLAAILRKDYTAIGSDSAARSFDGVTAAGVPHPRGFGTCPRLLGKYVRDRGVLTLSQAVYRMTGLPASIFQIRGRGVIKEGFFADITVFDPVNVQDTADYRSPFQRPEGIHHVFINGTPVVFHGKGTDALPGRLLRKSVPA
ncbi:MAG: D-aminoacylase [Nitrospiraceae bacterium]|nr:MAG: D-aminoacylase [Nitrospiraceae bacterium]